MLQLATRFPRPIGDSSNPLTHAFPLQVRVVQGVGVDEVIYDQNSFAKESTLVKAFVAAAKQEIDRGAIVVGTSCGFLGAYQNQIAEQLSVPFLSSSLEYFTLPDFVRDVEDARFGVLTFDDDVLINADWFKRIAPQHCVVGGLPKNGHLYRVIRNDETQLNHQLASQDVLVAAKKLANDAHEEFGRHLTAVLCECTNLGPYKTVIEEVVGCPVIDYNFMMARAWARI